MPQYWPRRWRSVRPRVARRLGRRILSERLTERIHYAPDDRVAVLYDEQSALTLAYEHYTDFLKYGGPEQGELLSAVQRRVSILKPRLATAR